jgi:hypothetical protein
MRAYNIIVLVSTAILIATVVTIIFAIAVYLISRSRQRKIQEESESVPSVIVKLNDTEKVAIAGEIIGSKDVFAGKKILKLYDPYKSEENRKNGS